jgi:hypothetical protein
VVTSDAFGNLAATELSVSDLASDADLASTNEGVAMAMALSGVPAILPARTNYSISTNWGGFGRESAIAVGGAARLTDNIFLNAGGGYGNGGRRNGGGRAGVTFAW